ncbi:hypothetical protein CGMCC3_g16424 [Colletotrichum fructicola]|uniref:ubiquitinyl hydrolase 1 n=1 Tax=Colletotrichum fructicola (strain Nara gc5) TaxID=1213859 RepID=A0A7J6IF82_COLFN|nr:uncharacterized protein CGMCC3_g16424 [Colletotrichum fructicola]KAE9567462.1 hypothetical protein CGMCC3_g16424 [Colletotrichum fructicola]KAF4430868.1 hypothetical protein CFRS1_v009663 [Colletotrichum fructicola]KAF4474506.1 hypothetical protein CGGC5_v017152 [Colletotrichum fructicola Nara gc5]KAF4881527.1 hypothetical protein CGCFRS4_v015470 [Colletotrichum fructicola]
MAIENPGNVAMETTSYLVRHVFLPSQLPQGDDLSHGSEMNLVTYAHNALATLRDHVAESQKEPVTLAAGLLRNTLLIHKSLGGSLAVDEGELTKVLRRICDSGGSVVLHIGEQNAGVLISRVGSSLQVEAFELSPSNEAVIKTAGRLRRTFPGTAVSVSLEDAREAGFITTVAATLSKMSAQSASDTKHKTKKAGQMQDENRDTSHPKLVTELLNGFLLAVGQPATCNRIWKNTREEVLWKDARLPWRRSPIWLLIRVAVQLTLVRSAAPSEDGVQLYKTFMAFLMGDILQKGMDVSLHSDMLYSMTAKLSRRLIKIGPETLASPLEYVRDKMRYANKVLLERWSYILKDTSIDLIDDFSRLKTVNFSLDTVVANPNLDSFLTSLEKRSNASTSRDFTPSWKLAKYDQDCSLPHCLDSMALDKDHMQLDLASFEAWVETMLDRWMASQLAHGYTNSCSQLRQLIEVYHRIASSEYDGNPESTSIMLLTILELWIACDKAAVHAHPLLVDYDAGIPTELFQSLLLPSRKKMERLSQAERYLANRSRHRMSRCSDFHVYTTYGSPDSFSVRYFVQSGRHQTLLTEIEANATADRDEKRRELARLKSQYQSLMSQYSRSNCNSVSVWDDWEGGYVERHFPDRCTRCTCLSQAERLHICVHEWPLPRNVYEKKSVVFELALPQTFGYWREASFYVLMNVLKLQHDGLGQPSTRYPLLAYDALRRYAETNVSKQRVDLLSETKPNVVVHRNPVPVVSANESNVLLNNGLHFKYFDDARSHFIRDLEITDDIPLDCTYNLPSGSESLQKFIYRPASAPDGPPPNSVIASQNDCPLEMTVGEYKALGSIPLGHKIQWQNILVQLFSPAVDFKKWEVAMTIWQCIHQAGLDNGSVSRSAHEICEDERFAGQLLEGVREATRGFEENWQSSTALAAFISVARRLLTVTQSPDIERQCLDYLRQTRSITFRWALDLREKARNTIADSGEGSDSGDSKKIALQRKAMEVLLICTDTFNLDSTHQRDVLEHRQEASIYFQCATYVQEYSDELLTSLGAPVLFLYARWQRTLYSCYRYVATHVTSETSAALDDAILACWPAYSPSGTWAVLSEKHDCWLASYTASSSPQSVHFGLVSGEFLVDGVPLDRLPANYRKHPAYRTLFGRLSLDIMPSPVPGMQYSSTADYAGHEVHVALNAKPDFLVHAVQDGKKFDLVPSHHLDGRFPTFFVDNHVHWYNHDEGCVEFCDIQTPWKRSAANWKLRRCEDRSGWVLSRDEDVLVGLNTASSRLLAKILAPLETATWIHVILRSSKTVFIDIPRSGLEFTLKPGTSEVVSRQYRGMSVDTLQSIGTLVALRDKLALTTSQGPDSRLPPRRKVLVLEGKVSYVGTNSYVKVDIGKGFGQKAHAYDVDDKLGRLVSNGSRQSKLFLSYLHALTSFCLPDPLTGKTGTEEALTILASASLRSFDCLAPENVAMLERLARLTPGRTYYPPHERVMQTVEWDKNLSPLSQNGVFLERVRSIFEDASRSVFFHPQLKTDLPDLDHVDDHLLRRDNIRASAFRVSGFGAELHCTTADVEYQPRDRAASSGGVNSHSIAQVVFANRRILSYLLSPALGDQLRRYIKKGPAVSGPGHSHIPTAADIAYDAGLLTESSDFITTNWIALHKDLVPRVCKFRLMIWLATLAFAKDAHVGVINTLAAFRTTPEVREVQCPAGVSFKLSEGSNVNSQELRRLIKQFIHPANMVQGHGESGRAYEQRRTKYNTEKEKAVNGILACLESQWPCPSPNIPSNHAQWAFWNRYVKIKAARSSIQLRFKAWHDNKLFVEYLERIVTNMPQQNIRAKWPSMLLITTQWNPSTSSRFVSADASFERSIPPPPARAHHALGSETLSVSREREYRMPGLLEKLRGNAQGVYERRYVDDLDASHQAMQRGGTGSNATTSEAHRRDEIAENLRLCKEEVSRQYNAITEAVVSLETGHAPKTTEICDVYSRPRVSPTLILQRINKENLENTPMEWRERIADYGVALTQLQRAERMVTCQDDPAALENELRNPGHTNWTPLKYPDTLLLEIDSGMIVREVQESIAEKMRNPPSGKNAVMQLNMGEGKSAVIVPIVAAALADGSALARVVVAKPQARQAQQMLESQLGGLVGRRVFHLPFSRAIKIGQAEAAALFSICVDCRDSRGVLLVQPEHILSFQLMGIETAINGNMPVSRSLLKAKDFLDGASRDIVDESDENFSVKFELVYTVGTQRPIEHSPDRWICIHHVLDIVRKASAQVHKLYPDSVEVSPGHPGCFPRLRILRDDAKDGLLNLVARQLSEEGFAGLPMASQSKQIQAAVFDYIYEVNLSQAEIDAVENSRLWSPLTRNTLLLLRGLVALNVLAFGFCQKRWKVDYGLDPNRKQETRLAVPYRAKDNPSARSEFSHPEVIITLTSLSYYYGGLTDEALRLTFAHLLRTDQADMEYQAWVADSHCLPPAFQQLAGINLDDERQCTEQVFPCFRYAKGTVDYFLAHIVFPKELKEFPHKLSASGWDIGEKKPRPTTGFSGTNDSRAFLPLTVEQLEDKGQQHTNALVLEYLLQDETSVVLMPKRKTAGQTDAELLLEMVTRLEPPARVILDVGAQILELDNIGVAKRWLAMTDDHENTQAVIFCDENDQLCVVDRRGRVESFQTSPFAGQTDVCLVFLDEAHTRGTDLKLPASYRAAVTLGAGLTKDRLVQACMRMRKLGKGQSVTFCVPDEIQQKIRSRRKESGGAIAVVDILEWAISETFTDLRRGIWLWANQGRRHQEHRILWKEAQVNGTTKLDTAYAARFLEAEAQTLESRYRPKPFAEVKTAENSGPTTMTSPDPITERLLELQGFDQDSVTFREEQERELSPEIEQEREIQRPPPATPAEHSLHPDLRRFVTHGIVPEDSKACMPAFSAVSDTTAARHFDVGKLPGGLLVTSDFALVIIKPLGIGHVTDLFQRSVQWILTSASGTGVIETAVVISPFEAQQPLSEVKRSSFVSLHLYSPRPNMGFRPLDGLDLYTVPHRGVSPKPALSLATQLNLFAGQLYLKSMEEYRSTRRFLQLSCGNGQGGSNDQRDSDAPGRCDEGLVQFLKVVMTKLRRDCESIDKTHVGRILDQRVLGPGDFR